MLGLASIAFRYAVSASAILPSCDMILPRFPHAIKKEKGVTENEQMHKRGEWPSGLNSFRQVTEVKLGRVRSNSGWVTSEV